MKISLNTKKLLCALALCSLIVPFGTQTTCAADHNLMQYGPGYVGLPMATEAPAEGYLGDSSMTLVSNQTDSQMLSVLLETNNGQIVMIDGGTSGDTAHLVDLLAAKGGRVSAWLVTHPHSDHIGALTEILNHPEYNITIDHVYGSLAPIEWYYEYEAYRADTVQAFLNALSALPADHVHISLPQGHQIQVDNVKATVLNQPYLISTNSINNSSVAYRLNINDKTALFLGDMGEEAGARLLADYTPDQLKSHIVQMSHHGQNGVSREVYQAIRPEVCLWAAPEWLWNNDHGKGFDTASYETVETRLWMIPLNVPYHLCIKDGDRTIR